MSDSTTPAKHIIMDAAPLLAAYDRLARADMLPLPGALAVAEETGLPLTRTAEQEEAGTIAKTAREVFSRRISALISPIRKRGWANDEQVDRICIDALGVHPMEVYGWDWFEIDNADSPLRWENVEGVAA